MKKADPVETFGKLLRKLRDGNGWTQEDLAGELQCDRAYVSQLERGVKNPSLRTMIRLAHIFKTELLFAGINLA